MPSADRGSYTALAGGGVLYELLDRERARSDDDNDVVQRILITDVGLDGYKHTGVRHLSAVTVAAVEPAWATSDAW